MPGVVASKGTRRVWWAKESLHGPMGGIYIIKDNQGGHVERETIEQGHGEEFLREVDYWYRMYSSFVVS